MTTREIEDQAREYIDKALESQRALGHESTPTEEEYQRAVARAARAFAELAEPASDDEAEQAVPA